MTRTNGNETMSPIKEHIPEASAMYRSANSSSASMVKAEMVSASQMQAVITRLCIDYRQPLDRDRDRMLAETLVKQGWTVPELEAAVDVINTDPELSRSARFAIAPDLFAAARVQVRENARKAAPDRPSCKRCLHRPEGIAGSGVCRECWDKLDKERADAELASAKPMEWK